MNSHQHEYRLQVACVKHLRSAFPGLKFWHTPNQTRDATEAFFNKEMGVEPGVSDFIITWPWRGQPKVAAVELKTDSGRVSSKQNMFLSSVQYIGWHTAVCRSVKDVHTRLKEWGLHPIHNCIEEPDYADNDEKFRRAEDFFKP